MALRPIWRGHLRLALVSCPVALYSAKHDRGTIRFNMINPETGNRIRMLTVDAETEKELQRRDLVKGYEFKKNHYLLLSDADFESVRVESSSVMTIEKFVEKNSIDPIYFNASYYLAPDGNAGRDVYAVLYEAISATGRVALSRVVIGQRERTIALMPTDGGLVAHTLDEQRDINDAKQIFDDVTEVKTDPEMVQLAKQLIDRQTAKYEPVGHRGSLRDKVARDARCQVEGRRHRPQRTGRTRSDQRGRPYGGLEEKPGRTGGGRASGERGHQVRSKAEACGCCPGSEALSQASLRR